MGKTNRSTERQKMSGWNELEQNDCVIESYIEITLRCVWCLSLCGCRPTVGGKYCLGERKRFRSCNIDVSLIPTHHLLTPFVCVCLSVWRFFKYLRIYTNFGLFVDGFLLISWHDWRLNTPVVENDSQLPCSTIFWDWLICVWIRSARPDRRIFGRFSARTLTAFPFGGNSTPGSHTGVVST